MSNYWSWKKWRGLFLFKRNETKNCKGTLTPKMPFAARFSCCATIDFNSRLKYFPRGLWWQILYQNLWNLSNYWSVKKSFLPRFLPNVLSISGLFLDLPTVNFALFGTDIAFCFSHYLAPSLKADLNLKQA